LDHVIQWGIEQNKELGKDISEWNKEDFKILKDILEDIIPLMESNLEIFLEKSNLIEKHSIKIYMKRFLNIILMISGSQDYYFKKDQE